MSDWNRMCRWPLPLTLLMGVAAAAPVLPSKSVAETALQAALSTPASTPSAAPVQASVTPPVKASPAPIPSQVATMPTLKVSPVKPAKVVAKAPIKTAVKPKLSAEQLRQQAIAQAQAAAPRRTGRSVVAHSTAYNSFAAQTDASPTITATGTRVHFGVIALSRDLLRVFPYGSKVTLEDLSGRYSRMLSGKVFVVEDTMHPRMYNTVDVWMPTRSQAMQWGARNIRITAVK